MTPARLAAVAAVLGLLAPASALAQQAHPGDDVEHPPIGEETHHHEEHEAEAPAVQLPLRIIASLDFGSTLRLVTDPALRQTTFAPLFLEARGGVVFPGSGILRHGVVLGVNTNLTGDGPTGNSFMGVGSGSLAHHGRDQGLDGFTQWTLTPAYLAYFRLSEDFVATARFGIPFVVSPYLLMGLELGGSIAWMITAGFGIYAEFDVDLWFGIDSSPNPGATYPFFTLSGALGVVIDYEVLP